MRVLSAVLLLSLSAIALGSVPPPQSCKTLDCPKYDVVKTYPNFEIRRYPAQAWVSVNSTVSEQDVGDQYQTVVQSSFMQLFHYIDGENVNKSKIPMAAPVLTSIAMGVGASADSNAYAVSFFVPFKYQPSPIAPTNPSVSVQYMPEVYMAVRSFTGYILSFESGVAPQMAALSYSLMKHNIDYQPSTLFIAQYDQPTRIFGRHNEVMYLLTDYQ